MLSPNSSRYRPPNNMCPEEFQTRDREPHTMVTGSKRKASSDADQCSKRLRDCDSTHTGSPVDARAVTQACIKRLRRADGDSDGSEQLSAGSSATSTREQNTGVSSRAMSDKYKRVEILGEGGFASVYAGYRLSDQFPVAIKYIKKKDVKTKTLILRGNMYDVPLEVLLQLIAGGGKRDKLAPVQVLDMYHFDNEIAIVMERPVNSVELANYCHDRKGLQEDEAKNVMRQMVDAAMKMHALGIFHRDLKMENILLECSSDVPRVRILDFGCSCIDGKKPFSSYSGTTVHAPPEFFIWTSYMAEQTTVWQLGVLLYEMLNGAERFQTVQFMKSIKKSFMSFGCQFSQDCQDFFWRCATIDPEYRATLEELQQHPWLR